MKFIAYFGLVFASFHALAGEFALVTFWRPGQRIDWSHRELGWAITQVRLVHPNGDEPLAPPSHLEFKLRYNDMKPTTHVITVVQARERGFSLDDLRTRLQNDGYRSIIALNLEHDGTLLDFVLQLRCELPLLRADP